MENYTLCTRNLSIGYHQKKLSTTIANDINISLKKGKLTTLIGANGIGKSTLLRTITKVQKPINGEVLLDNLDLKQYTSQSLAQNMSLVLTEKLPPSNLTVYELVALGRQPYTNWIGKLSQEDLHHIEEAIQLTEIEHLQNKKHFELSDGQMQKVLIARALAQNTPLIILDEPTTHLDLLHKVMLFRLLKKLTTEKNKTILFSTHDIDLAIEFSDEMILMTPEKISQSNPQDLIQKNEFDQLFKNDQIHFDSTKGKFIYNNI